MTKKAEPDQPAQGVLEGPEMAAQGGETVASTAAVAGSRPDFIGKRIAHR